MASATRSLAAIQSDEKSLRDRVAHLVDEKRSIEVRLDIDGSNDGLEERLGTVQRGIDRASAELEGLKDEHRGELRRRITDGSVYSESEQDQIDDRARLAEPATRVQAEQVDPHRRAALDGAMRTLERCQHSDVMSDRAAGRMERLVRHSDPSGVTARYLTAVGDPAYNAAFGKLLQYGDSAAMRMTASEMTAVQRVTQVESERAMMDGIGASGGFAIPIAIDPTILLTSSGALNPIRDLADVREIVTSTLRLVSADTPASSYGAELQEVTDGSPTFVQPTITAQKGQSFIPFSIEIGQDWGGMQNELLKLLADGRAILDATKFLSGTGTAEPVGIFAATGGLTTTQRIQSATTATLAIADVYALREGLAATRFFANAAFAAHPTVFDTMYRFVGGGNTTEPLPMPQGRGGPLVGAPKAEWSAMSTATTTTGAKMAVLADWSGYVIADRIGAQIELIPHLFGAANRFPTGERGFYYYWRTGSAVSKPNAFRYLELK
jgi:HK97 family phage major capsid protein